MAATVCSNYSTHALHRHRHTDTDTDTDADAPRQTRTWTRTQTQARKDRFHVVHVSQVSDHSSCRSDVYEDTAIARVWVVWCTFCEAATASPLRQKPMLAPAEERARACFDVLVQSLMQEVCNKLSDDVIVSEIPMLGHVALLAVCHLRQE